MRLKASESHRPIGRNINKQAATQWVPANYISFGHLEDKRQSAQPNLQQPSDFYLGNQNPDKLKKQLNLRAALDGMRNSTNDDHSTQMISPNVNSAYIGIKSNAARNYDTNTNNESYVTT